MTQIASGNSSWAIVRALNEEATTLRPLERDSTRHDFIDQRVGRLRGPGADQRVEGLKRGV